MKDPYEILREYIIKPKGMFIWRDVPGYDGRYQISNHGEVRTIWNKIVSNDQPFVVLISIDKRRQNVSRRKLLKAYWHKDEHSKGEEQWKKLDHYGNYFISNYGNVKNCKTLVLWPTNGFVVLYKRVEGKRVRDNISVVKLFLNTFPPYEVEINDENKTVNYKKKDANIVDSSLAFAS